MRHRNVCRVVRSEFENRVSIVEDAIESLEDLSCDVDNYNTVISTAQTVMGMLENTAESNDEHGCGLGVKRRLEKLRKRFHRAANQYRKRCRVP